MSTAARQLMPSLGYDPARQQAALDSRMRQPTCLQPPGIMSNAPLDTGEHSAVSTSDSDDPDHDPGSAPWRPAIDGARRCQMRGMAHTRCRAPLQGRLSSRPKRHARRLAACMARY